jgi:hypothetical protein
VRIVGHAGLSELTRQEAFWWLVLLFSLPVVLCLVLGLLFYLAARGDQAIAQRKRKIVEVQRDLEVKLNTGEPPVPLEERENDHG